MLNYRQLLINSNYSGLLPPSSRALPPNNNYFHSKRKKSRFLIDSIVTVVILKKKKKKLLARLKRTRTSGNKETKKWKTRSVSDRQSNSSPRNDPHSQFQFFAPPTIYLESQPTPSFESREFIYTPPILSQLKLVNRRNDLPRLIQFLAGQFTGLDKNWPRSPNNKRKIAGRFIANPMEFYSRSPSLVPLN